MRVGVLLILLSMLASAAAAQPPLSVPFAGGVRTLTGTWEGITGQIEGQVVLVQRGTAGDIAFRLPGALGLCVGRFNLNRADRGTWKVNCDGGRRAHGDFSFQGVAEPASGSGVDVEGRAVDFTLSPYRPDEAAAFLGGFSADMRRKTVACMQSVSARGISRTQAQGMCECMALRLPYSISADDVESFRLARSMTAEQEAQRVSRLDKLVIDATKVCSAEVGIRVTD